MIRAAAVLAATLAPTIAGAAGSDVVQGLADVIAAEEFCGLSYDQSAIETFIGTHVAADDLDFTGMLTAMIYLAEENQKAMSPSAATAHCAQIRRLAGTYRFTAP